MTTTATYIQTLSKAFSRGDAIEHYQKTVAGLTRTRALMLVVDAVVDGALWPSSLGATA